MTGEVTLQGQVLPVGGIKDKILAAHRLGIDTIILPKKNENDLDELPDDVRGEMKFILVDRVDDALRAALVSADNDADSAGEKRTVKPKAKAKPKAKPKANVNPQADGHEGEVRLH
jgi:ATP-dependent Lon protease